MAWRSPPALSIPHALLAHVNTLPLPSYLPGSAATFHLILKPFNSSVIPSLSPVIHLAHSCRDMSPCSPLSLGSADSKGVLHPHICYQGMSLVTSAVLSVTLLMDQLLGGWWHSTALGVQQQHLGWLKVLI